MEKSKFQKRHYETIAECIKETLDYSKEKNMDTMAILYFTIIVREAFKRDNFNFSSEKFLKACGLEE